MNLTFCDIDVSQKFDETSKLSKSIKERNEDLIDKYYEYLSCISQLDPDLECVICTDVVQDPLECERLIYYFLKYFSCAHVFCRQCVMQWVTKRGTCPFECSKKWILKIAHPKYFKMLSKLRFHCNKCNIEIGYQDRRDHMHNFIPQLSDYEKQHYLARNENNYFCQLSQEIEEIINLNRFCKVVKFNLKFQKQFGFKDGNYFINIENPLNMYIEEQQWHNQYSLLALYQINPNQWFYKSKYPHQWINFPQKISNLIQKSYQEFLQGTFQDIFEYEYAGNIKQLNFKQMVMKQKDSHVLQDIGFILNS